MAFSILNTIKKIVNYRRNGETLEKEYAETSADIVVLETGGSDGITQSNVQDELEAIHTKINNTNEALANKAGSKVVSNIAARDALTIANDNVVNGYLCYVADASADSTVTSGAAVYMASVSGDPATITWVKWTEYESLDRIIDWSEITNKEKDVVHVSSTPSAMPAGLADGGICVVDLPSA